MKHVTYTRFLEHVQQGEVTEATITAGSGVSPVVAHLRDGRVVEAVLQESYGQALQMMQERRVNVDIAVASPSLWNALPFALLLVAWVVLCFRRGFERPAL